MADRSLPEIASRWTVLGPGPTYRIKSGKAFKTSLCRCACGTEKVIRNADLSTGHSLSCGCLKSDLTSRRNTTHGLSQRPEYIPWLAMKQRCYDQNCKHFSRYGARGIKVCDQWLNSFETFLADVGPRPSVKHSIDRYPDNNGNYEPGNVRWATPIEQARNKNSNHIVTINGESKCLAEWGAVSGVHWNVILERINRGWPETDLLIPSRGRAIATHKRRKLDQNSVAEIARRFQAGCSIGDLASLGFSKSTLHRIRSGTHKLLNVPR